MAEYYEIKIKGQLDQGWSEGFAGLILTHLEGDGTLLSGLLPDQAALHGLLERIRDLNLTLISVTCGVQSTFDSDKEEKGEKMKTPTAGSNEMVGSPVSRGSMLRKVLLICGIVSSLFYAAMDVIGGTRWQDYSWISQEFSRLSAIGAPSRPLHLVLSPIYTLLVVAFGLGVWRSAGKKGSLRVVGGALIAYGLVSAVWPQFFPEDLTKHLSAFTNTMHILITVLTVLSWLLILGFGATVFGKGFRLYSIGTLLTVFLFGGPLTGMQAAAMLAGKPAPWLGLMERINLYSFMLWLIVLAIGLLRTHSDSSVEDGERIVHVQAASTRG